VHGLDDVMEGGQTLEKVMESVRGWLMERDVEALIADDSETK
jgi:peptide chain release factor 1